MPPAKAGAMPVPGAGAASSNAPSTTANTKSINAGYLAEVSDKVSTILNHKVFKNIATEHPLEIKKGNAPKHGGGIAATFKYAHFKAALDDVGTYEATGNFWWQNPVSTLNPNIPINRKSVLSLADHHFSTPARIPIPLAVGFMHTNDNPLATAGEWKRITPEEMVHAFIFGVARSIDEGTDEHLPEWKRHMLTVSYSWQLFESEEAMFWRSITFRQDVAAQHQAMVRTTFQMIHEVAEVKKKAESQTGTPVSAKAVWEAYKSNVVMHGKVGEDAFNPSFVDNALTIEKRIFHHQATRSNPYSPKRPLICEWRVPRVLATVSEPLHPSILPCCPPHHHLAWRAPLPRNIHARPATPRCVRWKISTGTTIL